MSIDLAAMRADLASGEARILTDSRGVIYVANPEGRTLHPYGQGMVNFALGIGWAQCGTCGVAWDDRISTSVTPTPSARCPFEYDHEAIAIIRGDKQDIDLRVAPWRHEA